MPRLLSMQLSQEGMMVLMLNQSRKKQPSHVGVTVVKVGGRRGPIRVLRSARTSPSNHSEMVGASATVQKSLRLAEVECYGTSKMEVALKHVQTAVCQERTVKISVFHSNMMPPGCHRCRYSCINVAVLPIKYLNSKILSPCQRIFFVACRCFAYLAH